MNDIEEQIAATKAQLGARLEELRRQRGLSLDELARCSGLNAAALAQAEKGAGGLGLAELCALAAALGVTPSQLLEGIGPAGAHR